MQKKFLLILASILLVLIGFAINEKPARSESNSSGTFSDGSTVEVVKIALSADTLRVIQIKDVNNNTICYGLQQVWSSTPATNLECVPTTR